MNRIAKYLNQHIEGAVYSAPLVLTAYATDRSILKMYPRVVALPENTDDVRKLLRFSNQLALKGVSLPVTVRGTGMDETGAAIGSGMVVSMENMNKIQEIDPRQRLVRLQTGVKLGELQAALALHGLTLPLNGHANLTIGGMIANYFSGAAAEKYGSIANYVGQAEVVLSNGDVMQTAVLNARNLNRKEGLATFEGEIYRALDKLVSENEKILAAVPDPKNDLSGYPFVTKLKNKKGGFDLLPILYGSQGTLGVVTEVIMRCELIREKPQYVAMLATDVKQALKLAGAISGMAPAELNVYDLVLFKEASEGSKVLKLFKKLPESGLLMVAAFDDAKVRKRAKKIKMLEKRAKGKIKILASDEENYGDFNELKSILSVYLNDGFRSVRVPLVDDAYIPRAQLESYFDLVQVLGEKYKIKLPIFGSVLTGHYSVRPKVDLSSVPGRQFALAFMRDYSKTVAFCKGALAAGAPEGRLKAVFTNAVMNEQVREIYRGVKQAMDPQGIMNPGLKQEATIGAVVRRLRTSYNQGVMQE